MRRPAHANQLSAGLARGLTEVTTVTCVGVDAVQIATWTRHLRLGGNLLLRRTYTPAEIAYCAGRVERLASRLAGKEAVLKALGTGIRGVGLRDIEIVTTPVGRPTVVLHDRAAAAANRAGIERVEVSLCHEEDYALAVAVGIAESAG
jgi:holo-[acyl-carrier protein] synthase